MSCIMEKSPGRSNPMPLTSTSTLGVLDDTTLVTYSYDAKHYSHFEGGYSIGSHKDLMLLGHALEIDSLFIVPGFALSLHARMLVETEHSLEVIGSKKRDGTPRFLLVWAKGENKKAVKLAFPEHDSRWPWATCTDASTLLKSILYLQDALEAEIAWSPGHAGQQLMLSMNEKHADWLAPVELPDVVKKNLAVDMQWKLALPYGHKHEPGMYLHLFDKNAMYLGACTSAALGEGSPVHVEKFDLFNPRIAGLWRMGREWYWTPEVEFMLAEYPDKRAAIAESWQWPKSHTALRTWGEHMWAARQE